MQIANRKEFYEKDGHFIMIFVLANTFIVDNGDKNDYTSIKIKYKI